MKTIGIIRGIAPESTIDYYRLFISSYREHFDFNLLYSRFGASQYVLHAVISIISTTIIVDIFWLKKPVDTYHKIAMAIALAAVVFFPMGQSKS